MAIDSGYWGNGAALDSGYWESGEDANVPTNADLIRSMTDEELSELLCKIDIRAGFTGLGGWVEWLKRPYKEDA